MRVALTATDERVAEAVSRLAVSAVPSRVGSMVDGPIVAVRGEATREVPAEVAPFSVTVAARDKDRQATLTRLAERGPRRCGR